MIKSLRSTNSQAIRLFVLCEPLTLPFASQKSAVEISLLEKGVTMARISAGETFPLRNHL